MTLVNLRHALAFGKRRANPCHILAQLCHSTADVLRNQAAVQGAAMQGRIRLDIAGMGVRPSAYLGTEA